MKPKLAIIGTGISGMACGHFLQKEYDVHLYEQNKHIGGHSLTAEAEESGKQIPIDMGFMVFNKKTYPNLTRLFDELKVPLQTIQYVLQCATLAQGIGILWVRPESSVWAAQKYF